MKDLLLRSTVRMFVILTLGFFAVAGESIDESFDGIRYSWSYGQSANRTYVFTNLHWWESLDHQMTSLVSLLALAKNTSSIAVIPAIPTPRNKKTNQVSLIGDFFEIDSVNQLQPVTTLASFLGSDDYRALKEEKSGTVPLPKNSQEEYESRLGILGKLRNTVVTLEMPSVDPENTRQKCNSFAGTMHLSTDGSIRYVFLDRIHFLHFCFEKFMPWWYDIRHKISPKQPYLDVVDHILSGMDRPVSVIHINDLMDSQKERAPEEVERYARQIVDALRKNQAISGSMLLIYGNRTRNPSKVVHLLMQEFDKIVDCSGDLYCNHELSMDFFEPPFPKKNFQQLFSGSMGTKMVSWALGMKADVFIGNIYSPFSRNVCLHRKTHGKSYSILRGFGELRKIWSWNL